MVGSVAPFQIIVEDGLEARPEKHVDSVKKAVQHGDPSPLHNHGVSVGDLDHEEESNAVAAGGEKLLQILDAQGQSPCEDLVESVVRLPLRVARVGELYRT